METMMKKMIWNVKKEEECELCQSGTYSFQYLWIFEGEFPTRAQGSIHR